MRYLVVMESVENGEILGPAENAGYMESIVIPTLETLSQWQKAGKITGGLLAGRRGAAFILDADSNEAVSDMVGSLPVWGGAEVEITPLEDIEYRLSGIKELVQRMKG